MMMECVEGKWLSFFKGSCDLARLTLNLSRLGNCESGLTYDFFRARQVINNDSINHSIQLPSVT